jgi:L-glyceraldehyde 3-phosphate reductase
MVNRWVEDGLLDVLEDEGIGCIAFSPLAQGLLTDKYLNGIPESSRAAVGDSFDGSMLTDSNLARVRGLNAIAKRRGQSLAQMALAWVVRDPRVTSVLMGASSWRQIQEGIGALDNTQFSPQELGEIDDYATDAGINLWATSSEAG